MTGKTRRVMYRCVDCGREMPSTEKVSRKVRLWGPEVKLEYSEDVCSQCALAGADGKPTRPAKSRSGPAPARSQTHMHDDTAA